MGAKDNAAVFILGKVASDPLTFAPCCGWNAEIGISVSLRVAGKPEIGSMNGAVLNLGIRTEAIKRPAWTPSNSAIGKLVSFACDESLHGVVSFLWCCFFVSLAAIAAHYRAPVLGLQRGAGYELQR
jgi:hypothetical protein